MEYILLSIYWILYYFFHSLLASDPVKQWAMDKLNNKNLWRILYSTFSTIGLLIVMFKMASIRENTLWLQHPIAKFLSLACITYGLIVIKLSFKNQSVWSFLTKEDRFDSNSLRTEGIYNKVRHPLYSGTILLFIGMFLFIPKISTIIALVITTCYVFIGIKLEERKLIKKYGEHYERYRNRVPALIPKLF